MNKFESWATWTVMGEEMDVLISGHYLVSKGHKATRYSPEEYPEVEVYDLTVELATGRTITPPKSFYCLFIEAHIDWQELDNEIFAQHFENEEAAIYYAGDMKMQEKREEAWI